MRAKPPQILLLLLIQPLVSIFGGEMNYQASPVDNPLRGVVPYSGEFGKDRFPHSMEFCYFDLAKIMRGWDNYDWSSVEKALNECKGRGKQTIFRIYLEYPGKPTGIPNFLLDDGLKVTHWKAQGQKVVSPDYSDPRMRRALKTFITALGEKYDGDPRIGFITAGMLGLWGEWHSYPRTDLWPVKEVQDEVMTAYEQAFKKTHILLRYPAGEDSSQYVKNGDRAFGYHDDSFAWTTADTGKPSDGWYFEPSMKRAGAAEKWKQLPIGGEIRPEIWATTFTDKLTGQQQDFDKCVKVTHVSWLMDSGLFAGKFALDDQRRKNAVKAIGKMGYELYISNASLEGEELVVQIENRGVAPFYYHWPIEVNYVDLAGEKSSVFPEWQLKGVLPGTPVEWRVKVGENVTEARIRVANPMEGGLPVRFANSEQQGEWLQLSLP